MTRILKLAASALMVGAVATSAPVLAGPAHPGGWGRFHGGWRGAYRHGGWGGWRAHYRGGFYRGRGPWFWGGPYWWPAFPPPVYWGYAQVHPPLPPPPPPPASPPPPPPQALAPAPKSFIVYFPFDKSILTPQARAVVEAAARYANDGHATRIEVVGHTDSSGSVSYNDALSEQRAKVMAEALVKLGVPAAKMDVEWKGKRELAVQTGDGVREPLNRRSTIRIDF